MKQHVIRTIRSSVLMAIIATAATAVIAVVVLAFLFVSASQEAQMSMGNATFPREVLSVPVLEGFRLNGRFGVHVLTGILLFPAAVFLVATALSLNVVRRYVTTRD